MVQNVRPGASAPRFVQDRPSALDQSSPREEARLTPYAVPASSTASRSNRVSVQVIAASSEPRAVGTLSGAGATPASVPLAVVLSGATERPQEIKVNAATAQR